MYTFEYDTGRSFLGEVVDEAGEGCVVAVLQHQRSQLVDALLLQQAVQLADLLQHALQEDLRPLVLWWLRLVFLEDALLHAQHPHELVLQANERMQVHLAQAPQHCQPLQHDVIAGLVY